MELAAGADNADKAGYSMNFLKKMADTSRRYLSEQKFSATGPGTIVADAEAMIAFIGEAGLTGGSRNGNLPTEVLAELNDRLAGPITLGLKRTLLRDYPNLGGVFVLLRVMDLVRAAGKRVEINPVALVAWRGLNATEKYFALLEAWLWRADAEVLGGETRRGRSRSQFMVNLDFLLGLRTGAWKEFPDYCHVTALAGMVSAWNAQLQMRFGLVEVRVRALTKANGKARQPGRGWGMEQARRTPWGQGVAWALLGAVAENDDDVDWIFDAPEGADFGFLQPAFRPFFPEWEKAFGLGPAGGRPGLYVFKVTMTDRRAEGAVWRRLAVPGGVTLGAVADAVLQAFEFSDTEHLYELRFRDRLGKGRVYHHGEMDEGPYADDVELAGLNLPDRAEIAFRFDFGDDWRWELRLERVEPPGEAKQRITLLESVGVAPEQYPDWS